VVGLTTILLSEAVALGRSALSVVPRASEREWLLDPPQGKVNCVWQRASLAAALKTALEAQA